MTLLALFRLAFAAPPTIVLSLPHKSKSPAHASIGTPPPSYGAMTACKSTVSGSISLPSRGSFHLSLTVLVHYRSLGIFSLARWSAQIQSTFHEHRPTQVPSPYSSFSPTGLSPSSVQASTLVRLNSRFRLLKALQPPSLKERVWAFPASLAATKGIDVSFFSSSYLDVSVRSVPFFCKQKIPVNGWVSPFGHPRVNACFQLVWAFRR